jgi:hypothetical protein
MLIVLETVLKITRGIDPMAQHMEELPKFESLIIALRRVIKISAYKEELEE